MMTETLSSLVFALLGLFPLSFLIYVMSERINSIHQSRVGKGISFGSFLRQAWSDVFSEIRLKRGKLFWLTLLTQVGIVFLLDFDIPFLVFGYLTVNLFLTAVCSPFEEEVVERIEADRSQLKFFLASVLALLVSSLVFAHSESTSLSEVVWSPFYFLLIPLFQISGAILFGENPFVSLNQERGYLLSVRFYVWCLLSTKLFLGGGFFYLDNHLKAAALFIFCRLLAQYFPRYTQKDLFRLALFYLIPISVVLWLTTMLILGTNRAGGMSV